MIRGWKKAFAALLAIVLLLAVLLLSVTHWLPRLAGLWLPANATLRLDGPLRLRHGALVVPGIHYSLADCELAAVSTFSLARNKLGWRAAAESVRVNTDCVANLASTDNNNAPRTLAEWQQMLPTADISIGQLTLLRRPEWAGKLQLRIDSQRQVLRYHGEKLALEARLQQQQLTLNTLSVQAPGVAQPLSLSGKLTLPRIPNALPDSGTLNGDLTLAAIPDPLHFQLDWQQQRGRLQVTTAAHQQPLLTLPWEISARQISLHQGAWFWPYTAQPLAGSVTLTADNWREGVDSAQLTARINLLTHGRGGKGNAVLSVGPGKLDWHDSQLPFQLNGDGKLAQLQFFARLPGALRGPLLDPQLRMRSGALLRMKGRLLSTLDVDEARWPLAGVTLTADGVSGPLQAIFSAHDVKTGHFRLHLDGRATNFWPDRGQWLWRYWGTGRLTALAANWDVRGQGRWQDTLIELSSLSSGFNRLSYGSAVMEAPRLTLERPLRWQRAASGPALAGQLSLKSKETRFSSGGYLPPAALTLGIKGRSPTNFLYQGSLEADNIGPLRLRGRWDGTRLRGQAWWPQQSLRVFQPLLSPALKLAIADGTLKAQIAFSVASDQGLKAGGHWLVTDGSVRLPDNQINGIDFSLPFRIADRRWYFGTHGPVSLRIKEINNQVRLQNVAADLQGWYPWSRSQPLRLSNVSLDLLGGQLSLASLQMPQTAAAMVRVEHLSLSQLVTAMKLKQIALSGYISGALPLWLNNSRWLVKNGWVANRGSLTVRMDKDMADAISNNNIAAGAAIDWLRYMEISRSRATLDLDNLGMMTMTAHIAGSSRFSNRSQQVTLNYTQQENFFQLWRSLRFGDNLQSWLAENASLPPQKEKRDESSD